MTRSRMIAVVALALVPLLASASRDLRQQPGVAVAQDSAQVDDSDGTIGRSVALPVAPIPMPVRHSRPVLDPARREEQLRVYRANAPKTILELQPFRYEATAEVERMHGIHGAAALVNLNPSINAWYVLELSWAGEKAPRGYHLENNNPAGQDLVLDADYPRGLAIVTAAGSSHCDLWSDASPLTLETASALPQSYVPLCQGALALRNETEGHQTAKERVSDFLRDNVWLGEELTVMVRNNFFRDAYLSTASRGPGLHIAQDPEAAGRDENEPLSAKITCDDSERCFRSTEIDIEFNGGGRAAIAVGDWYPTVADPGIFVSAMQPSLVSSGILKSHRSLVAELDEIEAEALVYLAAFDLNRFNVGFALGTDHPRVGWSNRVPRETIDSLLPGPDGIDTVAPLVATGIINPALSRRIAATFTAGFKRSHGAFKWSELAHRNQGSHYGFIENGVVFSKLQPGLATLVVYDDGALEMKTWSETDDGRLGHIRFARQNGVPLIETDETTGSAVPGARVTQWGPGNWSGSADRKLRSLRAGLCLQENGDERYLIYGYFSSATPSAMARVFQAYNCSYAMHLDMNALEHTYLGLYRVADNELVTEHLVQGMEVLDESHGGDVVPRFLGYADNRDFFYLSRREGSVETG